MFVACVLRCTSGSVSWSPDASGRVICSGTGNRHAATAAMPDDVVGRCCGTVARARAVDVAATVANCRRVYDDAGLRQAAWLGSLGLVADGSSCTPPSVTGLACAAVDAPEFEQVVVGVSPSACASLPNCNIAGGP